MRRFREAGPLFLMAFAVMCFIAVVFWLNQQIPCSYYSLHTVKDLPVRCLQ